jgi:hypothetical protein
MQNYPDHFDFDELVRAWPSALVARREVARFSGGLLYPRKNGKPLRRKKVS